MNRNQLIKLKISCQIQDRVIGGMEKLSTNMYKDIVKGINKKNKKKKVRKK